MFPIIIENSKIPVWLSKITPMNIRAISFFVFIICRDELDDELKRHEMIHFKQQIELLFIFQWFLYLIFYIIGLIKHRDFYLAYKNNPFEIEAFTNQRKSDYLKNRKLFSWTKYI